MNPVRTITREGVFVAYRFDVDAMPPRKNTRHKLANGRMVNGDGYREWVDLLRAAWPRPQIEDGLWSLEVVAYWPRRNRQLGFADVPLGDVDAPISCLADALQAAGVIDNDDRFMRVVGEKHLVEPGGVPRVVITLRRWEGAGV